jgi:hypothetical protein
MTTSMNLAKALYFETTELITYLVSLDFAGGITYKKYLPPFPSVGYDKQSTMGLFSSDSVFYVGSYGPIIFRSN